MFEDSRIALLLMLVALAAAALVAGPADEAEIVVNGLPAEPCCMDRLVNIGSNEETIRLLANFHQQSERAGIKVLRLVHDDCVVDRHARLSGPRQPRGGGPGLFPCL